MLQSLHSRLVGRAYGHSPQSHPCLYASSPLSVRIRFGPTQACDYGMATTLANSVEISINPKDKKITYFIDRALVNKSQLVWTLYGSHFNPPPFPSLDPVALPPRLDRATDGRWLGTSRATRGKPRRIPPRGDGHHAGEYHAYEACRCLPEQRTSNLWPRVGELFELQRGGGTAG